MPIGQQKATRGIPRKAKSPGRKARHKRYWDRSTCCGVVFRSPKLKRKHVLSGHDDKSGQRKSHMGVQQAAMQAIEKRLKGAIFGDA